MDAPIGRVDSSWNNLQGIPEVPDATRRAGWLPDRQTQSKEKNLVPNFADQLRIGVCGNLIQSAEGRGIGYAQRPGNGL